LGEEVWGKLLFMGMEDETRDFLMRILNTISMVLIWMLLMVFFGFYKDYAFFEARPNWTNYLFYTLALISFIMLIIYLRRKWKV
jgi:hypothetical protein